LGWRVEGGGLRAGGGAVEDYVTTLMQGSLYADRLPIGKVTLNPET
jgi:hypothetical protein